MTVPRFRPIALWLLALTACTQPARPPADVPANEGALEDAAQGGTPSDTGLTGQYFDDLEFSNLKLTRRDGRINFNWGKGSPNRAIGPDTFSVRWEGQVTAPITGSLTFRTVSDDGVRLFVGGQKLIDNWTDHAATLDSGTLEVVAGRKYDLKLEYYENGGDAVMRLEWQGPGLNRAVVPSSALSPFAVPDPAAGAYYVAPSGDDRYAGSLNFPLRTVQRCAEVVTAGKACVLRAGTYRETVTPKASGTSGAPIRFEGYPGETATISGADVLEGFAPYRGSIEQAGVTLPVSGYAETGFLANQVFVNGQMMSEARWPNSDPSKPLEPTLAGGSVLARGPLEASVENAGIPDISESWAGATVWMNEWYTSRTGTITGGGGGVLGATMHAPYDRSAYWFYLTGKLGLLDAAGEWFYDGSAQKLYLWWPPNGAAGLVEVKKRNLAFDLSDRSFVTVRNLDLFAATVTSSASSTGLVLDGLRAKYLSHFVTLPIPPAGVQAPGSDGAMVLAAHAWDTGIQLRGNGNTLRNSVLNTSAGNGVLLEGQNHLVENNLIRDSDYASTYAAPVRVNGNGHRILRNTVSGAGRDAIAIDWHTNGFVSKDVEIAYNDLSRFGALSSDLGGIYVCCAIDQTGSRIHHNVVHNPYGYSFFWDVAGIYTDNASFGATVDHNIVRDFPVRLPRGFKIAGRPGALERVYNNSSVYPGFFADTAQVKNNILGDAGLALEGASNNLFTDTNLSDSGPLFRGTDPLFTNLSAGDLSLRAGSPALDAGVVLPGFTDGFSGAAPDLGALESGVEPWKAGATLP